MKSLLEEASSVPKAIEKAWLAAGQPEEFEIKVFETEKRSFFGFLKKTAVVTILFDPRKTPQAAKESRDQAPRPPRRTREHGATQQKERPSRDDDKRGRDRTAQPAQRAQRPERPQPKEAVSAPKEVLKPAPLEKSATPVVAKREKESWTPELIDQMIGELKTICTMLEVAQPSKVDARGSTLRIDFAKPVIEDVEFERMLFSSFAHLLFQFVKREHRSKLRGLRIALSSGREQEHQVTQ